MPLVICLIALLGHASLVSRHEINILGSEDAAYDPLYSIKRKPVNRHA